MIRSTVAGCCLLVACAEPDRLRIVDGSQGRWAPADVARGTLTDLDHASGEVATLYYASAIDAVSVADVEPRDRAKDAAEFITPGLEPVTSWAAAGGVAVPLDLDTLVMFTAYVHAERSLGWFRDLGVVDEAVAPLDIHYLAEVTADEESGTPERDNAFYFLPGDTVVLLPPRFLQDIPLAMNLGVVAHELAHRVFYWEAWDARRLRVEVHTQAQVDAYYNLGAVDEGVADYFGAVISGDPAFLGGSIPFYAEARDLTVVRHLRPEWASGSDHLFVDGVYDPYPVGSVLAGALWRSGEAVGQEAVASAVLRAQRRLTPDILDLQYRVGDLEVAVLDILGGPPRACAEFLEAYDAVAERFDEVCR